MNSKKIIVGFVTLSILTAAGIVGWVSHQAKTQCDILQQQVKDVFEEKQKLEFALQEEANASFANMMKSGAVYKIKLRSEAEVKEDFEKSLAKVGLKITELKLSPQSNIPPIPTETEVIWEGELPVETPLKLAPNEVFQTQEWNATLAPLKKDDATALWERWKNEEQKKSFIAIALKTAKSNKDSVTLEFNTGMSLPMRLPKRTYSPPPPPSTIEGLKGWEAQVAKILPESLSGHTCKSKYQERLASFQRKLAEISEDVPSKKERLDRMVWLTQLEREVSRFLTNAQIQP